MTSVAPVNYGYSQQYYTNMPQMAKSVNDSSANVAGRPVCTDITDLFSQKELRSILKRIGTQAPAVPNPAYATYVPRYAIEYFPNSGAVVINNLTMTNDTTEIYKDGSVKHVGIWHNKEVAPADSFTDIIEEVESRIKAENEENKRS